MTSGLGSFTALPLLLKPSLSLEPAISILSPSLVWELQRDRYLELCSLGANARVGAEVDLRAP